MTAGQRVRRAVQTALAACVLGLLGGACGVRAQQSAAIADPRSETIVYTIQPGDTLFMLAGRYFLRTGDYRTVQRLNRIADPRRIPIGKVLKVPTSLLRAEVERARLVAARGTVTVRRDAQLLLVSVGMPIEVGTVLETGVDGLLTIELPNGSRTTLPTRSRLEIRQLRKFLLGGAIDYDLEVGAGKAETEAAPTGGRGNFRVRTPRAVSAVRGTRFRVGFAEETSSAEVLEGTVAVAASGGQPSSDSVTQGFGAWIKGDGEIVGETLLPAAELFDPGKVQIDPVVELRLSPVATASGYHVQIGGDAGFVDVIADQVVAEPVVRFEDIPNGNWFVRATALSQTRMEGLYQSYAMKRRLTGLAASADGDADVMRFRWSGAGEGRRVYRFQMTGEDQAVLPIVDEGGLGPEGIEMRDLLPGTYYWRVGVRQFSDGEMTEKWLPFEKLIIAAQGR